ncbi:hypothetical protein XENTR_v10009767 [Xenopus tropicalis]|nr:hypothetical protein XENTR_v10009767 [Xenopus tropicalis]
MNENIRNRSLNEFYLRAFSASGGTQILLFVGVLVMYLLAAFGNIMINIVICLESNLHKPMYFFLCNLGLLDLIYVSSTLPKLMAVTVTGGSSISFYGCITQMFIFATCVTAEFFLLTFMAYDRYVAICIPLRYSVIMNKRSCRLFATLSWLGSSFNSLLYCFLIRDLPFCNIHEIQNFYCSPKTMIKLSCSDITYIETLMSIETTFMALLPLLLILASYVFIICAIIKIPISTGRSKTFSSCSSHLTIVIIFCGTGLSIYIKPESEYSPEQEMLLSLLYAGVVPMLNPLVYSFRNTDVLKAIRKIITIAGGCDRRGD